MNLDRYNQIAKVDSDYNAGYPKAHLPSPAEYDYKNGYITRYFAQKSNDSTSPIVEINYKNYTFYATNPFYMVVSLDWVIVGNEAEVKEKNKKSILYASKKMKAIPLYLQNPIQFLKK